VPHDGTCVHIQVCLDCIVVKGIAAIRAQFLAAAGTRRSSSFPTVTAAPQSFARIGFLRWKSLRRNAHQQVRIRRQARHTPVPMRGHTRKIGSVVHKSQMIWKCRCGVHRRFPASRHFREFLSAHFLVHSKPGSESVASDAVQREKFRTSPFTLGNSWRRIATGP